MLTAKNRLRKRTEFAYSYKHGKSFNGANFSVTIFKRKDKLLRIGFSVSKKVGGAVLRNKVKRQMRAVIQNALPQIEVGYNLIFIAKPEITKITFDELNTQMFLMLKKYNLLKQ
jgi:ribonuclease P protein component